MRLNDKYLLLTGASGGIGQAIAHELDKPNSYITFNAQAITAVVIFKFQ